MWTPFTAVRPQARPLLQTGQGGSGFRRCRDRILHSSRIASDRSRELSSLSMHARCGSCGLRYEVPQALQI